MRRVWKYELQITDVQEIKAPMGAIPLHVGLDPNGVPCIWLEVDDEKFSRTGTVFIFGTGHKIPEDVTYHAGSFVQGEFVWHVYLG